MAKSSGMAVMMLLVGLLLSAQIMTAFGIRSLGELPPKENSTSTSVAMNVSNERTATADLEAERSSKVGPEVVGTVEDSTADGAVGFSPERVQMEQSGWSCSGGFSSQQHAWYCAGRSVY
ncbi:unnamed protein product [Calypogeia fissa]